MEAEVEESRIPVKSVIWKELDSTVGKPAFRGWMSLPADGHGGEPEFPVEANGTITQDNLNVVIDANWITEADLCQGVSSGSVSACG